MSSQEPKFKLFFGNFGEDGSAYYTQNLAIDYWPSIDPVKYKLASEISMLELGSKCGNIMLSSFDACVTALDAKVMVQYKATQFKRSE